LSVMFATIIGALVLFAFAGAGGDLTNVTETHSVTGVNATKFYFALTATPSGSDPEWVVTCHGSRGALNFVLTSANYTYISANNTIWVNKIGKYNTSVDFVFNTQAHTSIASVQTYAIIVFTMLAIVPLIIVGGVMLRSLGFFSGGTGKI